MVEPKSPRSPPSTASHTLATCGDLLDDRVYRAIKDVHAGMEIDTDAVDHIRDLMERLLREMMSACPGNVYELEKKCASLFSQQQLQWIYQKWSDNSDKWSSRLHRAIIAKDRQLHERLVQFIKETLSGAVRRDAKELERMALYLLTSVDCLAADVIKWTGHYVKKLRESGVNLTISLQNVKISLSADTSLMQLNEVLHRSDDDAGTSGQSMIFDFDLTDQMSPRSMLKRGAAKINKSYQEATAQFLAEERAYLRELNMLVNVFLRRFETIMHTTDPSLMGDTFGNITELHELSRKLERAIEDARELNDPFSAGAGLWELAEANEFDVYHTYVKHISSGTYLDTIARVLTVKKFAAFFENQAQPFTRRRDASGTSAGVSSIAASSASAVATSASFYLAVRYVLPQLLLVPIVHFFKYVEHCNRLQNMSQNEDDRVDLSNTRTYLTALAVRIEKTCAMNGTIQKRMKIEQTARIAADSAPGAGTSFDRILEIERGIDGYLGEPIARTCRELIREGDLRMVRPSVANLTQESLRRRWSTDRHVYVFDHLIVMCKSHKSGWKFKDRLSLRTAEIRDLEDTEVLQHAFKITGKEKVNGKGDTDALRTYAYTFVCSSAEEKEAWMEAMIGIQSRSLLDRMLDGYLKEERQKVPLLMPPSEQYPFADQDSDDNIVFEDYTSSSGIPVVKHGTIVKLVERLTYHLYTDNAYVRTFLISYRSFCKPSRLLELLILRFDVPLPLPLQQGGSGDAKSSLFSSSSAFRDLSGSNGSATGAAATTSTSAAAASVGSWRSGGPLAGRFDTVQSHGLSGTGGSSSSSTTTSAAAAKEQSIYSGFFNTSLLDQCAQRFKKEYEGPVQLKVLNVLRKWVVDHWYDFEADLELLEGAQEFLGKIINAQRPVSAQLRKFSKNILSILKKKMCASSGTTPGPHSEGHFNFAFDRDEETEEETLAERRRRAAEVNSFQPKKPDPLWHAARKGETNSYDLLSLHPIEIGRQLTLIHFDLYRAIKPIELVGAAWMRSDKYKRSPQLLKLTDHSTQLTYWVSRSIVETESLEERVAIFSRILEVMTVFEELHNFTGLVAFYSALNKACVHRLTWCWDRLDSEKQKCYDRFKKLCNPHWTEMVKRLQSINPPCVPFFGHYLTSIVFYEGGNSTFVNLPGNDMRHDQQDNESLLVSFLKCRRIANVISEIQMYQNEPYTLQIEASMRQFFESINPKGDFGEDGEALETYLYEKSLKIQPKEAEKPPHPDLKPKHTAATLRSPGIKPPRTNTKESGNLESKVASFAASFGHVGSSKSNTYTSRHTSHESQPKTAPPTPGYDTGDNGRSPVDPQHAAVGSSSHTVTHGRSPHPGRPNAPPEDSVPAHFVLADIESRSRSRAGTSSQTATLPRVGAPPSLNAPAASALAPPPPVLPRRAAAKPPSSAPSGAAPPPLHPRRPTGTSHGTSPGAGAGGTSPSSSSTSTTTSASRPTTSVDRPAAFVFPTAAGGSPPALPPRRRGAHDASPHEAAPTSSTMAEASSPNSLRVTLDSRLTLSPTSGDEASVSPTVSLSMPVPPALPPRRRPAGAGEAPPAPPPLPPKTNQSPPNLQAPPLPPKTYKRRMHSASPTNMD